LKKPGNEFEFRGPPGDPWNKKNLGGGSLGGGVKGGRRPGENFGGPNKSKALFKKRGRG